MQVFDPEDPAGATLVTANRSLIFLGPLSASGERWFDYRPLPPRTGEQCWARLRGPLRVGEAPRIGHLRFTPIQLIVRHGAACHLASLVAPRAQAEALARHAEKIAALESALRRGRGSGIADCEILAEVLLFQELLAASARTYALDETAEIFTRAGTSYRVLPDGQGRLDLLRTPRSGAPDLLRAVDIGPQRVVVGAPLVFFAAGAGEAVCFTGPVQRLLPALSEP